MSKLARHACDSPTRRPDQAGEPLTNRVAQLKAELAAKARHLEQTRAEVTKLECHVLLSECVWSAELLTTTLTELVWAAGEQDTLPLECKLHQIQNCRRAIANALLWVGKG